MYLKSFRSKSRSHSTYEGSGVALLLGELGEGDLCGGETSRSGRENVDPQSAMAGHT